VIALPVDAFAVRLRRDRWVLVCALAPGVDGDHHQAPAAGVGDPPQLTHRAEVVLDVLQHVRAQNRVERCVGQIDRGHVEA
jgi:hypothetical protein